MAAGRLVALAGAVALASTVALGLTAPREAMAQSAPACAFTNGFAGLRDAIGADVVGECLENQHASAGGDVSQRTTRGLLVWDHRHNRVGFTDGYHTWLGGPRGVQQRLNGELLDWEKAEAATETAAQARVAALWQMNPLELVGAQFEAVRDGDDVRLWQIYAVSAARLRDQLPRWALERADRVRLAGVAWARAWGEWVRNRPPAQVVTAAE